MMDGWMDGGEQLKWKYLNLQELKLSRKREKSFTQLSQPGCVTQAPTLESPLHKKGRKKLRVHRVRVWAWKDNQNENEKSTFCLDT
jgi:hypothetical protein